MSGRAGERLIREEPGVYEMRARFFGSAFEVVASAAAPVTLTLRVEDVRDAMPPSDRRARYRVTIRGLAAPDAPPRVLEDVAPDARIQFDLEREVVFRFDPQD